MTSKLGPFSTMGTSTTTFQRRTRLGVRALAATATAGVLFSVAGMPAFAAPGATSADSTVANVEVGSTIALTGLTDEFTVAGPAGAVATELAAVTMNVKTNNLLGYAVTVQAATATLTPAAPSTPVNGDSIPIGALTVRQTGAAGNTAAYAPLSNTAAVTVRSQATRSLEAGDEFSNDFAINIPFVNEDTYAVTLNYIATTL